MNTMHANTFERACFQCGSRTGPSFALGEWDIAGIGGICLDIRCCDQCGAVYQDPAPTPDSMEAYYSNYSNYTSLNRQGMPSSHELFTYHRHLDLLGRHLRPGRVFEIGCATGYLLAELNKLGWSVTGCDPSSAAVNVAKSIWGIGVEHAFFAESALGEDSMDLVIASHVLEHQYDPVAELRHAWRLLVDGGHLLVEVPCLDNPEIWGNGYFTFEHINYFTRTSLLRCLRQAGFSPLLAEISISEPRYQVLTVLARKTDQFAAPEIGGGGDAALQAVISEYLGWERLEWARINSRLQIRLANHTRVAIWGGGVHTSQLLANANVFKDRNVVAIIDSDSQKQGLSIADIPVCHPDALVYDAGLAVVISSKAFEAEIFEAIMARNGMQSEVICLYLDR